MIEPIRDCHNEPIMYWDPTGHFELSDKIAYNSGKMSFEDYNRIIQLSLLYDITDDLAYKNLYRQQAVEIRRNSYDPNYIDNYDYTYGGKFLNTTDRAINKTADLFKSNLDIKDAPLAGYVRPVRPTIPIKVPKPWTQPVVRPPEIAPKAGAHPILVAIGLAWEIISTPTEVNQGEQQFIDIKGEFEKTLNITYDHDEKRKEWINFDTVAAASICSDKLEAEQLRLQIGLLAKNKQLVMTEAAYIEFAGNLLSSKSQTEKTRALILMSIIKRIDNDPSEQFMKLKITKSVDSEQDKIVFGTGDKLNILTVTGDSKFIRGAYDQGIKFSYIDTTAKPQLLSVIKNYPNGVKVYTIDPIPWNK